MDFVKNKQLKNLVSKLAGMAKSRDLFINQIDLELELQNALFEYYNDRHFTPTDEEPYEVIYEGIILQLALSSIAKMGAEGENYHSEGGVIRTYDNASNYPLSLTRKIIPLAKGVGRK